MYCWLSALAMTCFADYQSSVLLSTWRQIFRWLSYLFAPLNMKYILLIIGSRHDVFHWLSKLCATVIMASDNALIIRAVCSLFHEICLVDYQLSPWYVSLIITSLWYLAMVPDISLIIRALCFILHVICLADYQLSPWHISLIITALCCSCHCVR